jgi:hypothetical protein
MKPLILLMFATVVICAGLSIDFATPRTMAEAPRGVFVLSIIGGIGGSMTLLSYGYFAREADPAHLSSIGAVRRDLAIAYLFTAVFGLSVMIIADAVFFRPGISLTDSGVVSAMAAQLGARMGWAGSLVYGVGFWAAVVASLVGVWHTTPAMFADCLAGLSRSGPVDPNEVGSPRSAPDRIALIAMAASAVPFAVLDRPLPVIFTFTVLGGFFVPLLAMLLLYLNNRVPFPEGLRRNNAATNALLIIMTVIFFGAVAAEVVSMLKGS